MIDRDSIPWRYILPPSALRVPAHTSLQRRDICQRGDLNPGALIPNVAIASTTLQKGYFKARQRSFITLRGIHL